MPHNPSYPLQVRIINSFVEAANQAAEDYSHGRGRLLNDEHSGFTYTTWCSVSLFASSKPYQGRWKSPGKEVELLSQARGKIPKNPKKCTLKVKLGS